MWRRIRTLKAGPGVGALGCAAEGVDPVAESARAHSYHFSKQVITEIMLILVVYSFNSGCLYLAFNGALHSLSSVEKYLMQSI